MDIYSLSRSFWDYAFVNPEKIKPNHVAVYFFAIEHCNRLGWKDKFGLPTSMVIEAIGIKSYSVFKKTFDDLVDYGFIQVIQYSKNQYSSNIIALKENNKAHKKALDKALIKHTSKQEQSTIESTVSIDIQDTNNQLTILQREQDFKNKIFEFSNSYSKEMLEAFFNHWSQHGENDKKMAFEKQKTWELGKRLATWKRNDEKFFKNGTTKQDLPKHDRNIPSLDYSKGVGIPPIN